MTKETQNEKILGYLQTHDMITPLEAQNYFGIMRLASRICDLQKIGYRFERQSVRVKNRYGDIVTVTGYKLKEQMQ